MDEVMKELLEAELAEEKGRHDFYAEKMELTKSVNGLSLSMTVRRGRKYYQVCRTVDGRLEKRYAQKSENRLIEIIQMRKLMQAGLNASGRNIKLISQLLDGVKTSELNDLIEELPAAYRDVKPERARMPHRAKVSSWKAEQERIKGRYEVIYPEGLKHVTVDQNLVRTKSEESIYSKLAEAGLEFVYERPTWICGKLKYPDFVIWSERLNCEIIWEHMGMMGDPEYRRRNMDKIGMYIEAGFRPGHDLILSFEGGDGTLDGYVIKKMIEVMFI